MNTRTTNSLQSSLWHMFFPLKWYRLIFIVLVVFKASSYWLVSCYLYPNEPLSVIAMYRIGDSPEYYPMIAGLASLNIGEYALFELHGQGIGSFPFASTLPHALGLHFFGATGFMLADMIIALCFYAVLGALLKIIGVLPFVAECTSLLIVSESLSHVFYQFTKLYHWLSPQYFTILFLTNCGALIGIVIFYTMKKSSVIPRWFHLYPLLIISLQCLALGIVTYNFWYFRLPRPFVTDVYFLLCLCFLARLLQYASQNKPVERIWRLWIGLGISFSALMQGEIYLAESTAFIILLLFFLFLRFDRLYRRNMKQTLHGVLLFAMATSIGLFPFFIQLFLAHPDVPRRLGVFPVPRTTLFLLPDWQSYFMIGMAWFLGYIVIHFLRQRDGSDEQRQQVRNIIVSLCVYCTAAWLAMPIMAFIMGKLIQPFHFPYRVLTMFSMTMLILLVYIIGAWIGRKEAVVSFGRFKKVSFSLSKGIVIVVLVMSSVSSLRFASVAASNKETLRISESDSASANQYRTDFLGLANELIKYKDMGYNVLGTFDYQVYSWWVTFHQGYSFMTYSQSPVPDQIMEHRLKILCTLLGMNPEEFRQTLETFYIHYYWLGHNKYQVSHLYTPAPLTEYSAAVQERIRNMRDLDHFEHVIPNNEIVRLMQDFIFTGAFQQQQLKLDIIVLTNGTFLNQFEPSEELFQLKYHNPTFRMWVRK